MPDKEAIPDDLRCNRSDGRQWRCKRRAMEGKKMCEIHHLQLSLRQHRRKVPESLKLVRTRKIGESPEIESNGGIRAQKSEKSGGTAKRKRVIGESEALDEAVRKMKLKRGDIQLDLIRMVLKREAEKRTKRNKRKKMKKENKMDFDDVVDSEEELMRVLPNGVMAISSSSPTKSNGASPCDVKVGAQPISVIRRRFRSKNIEPLPLGTMQAVPYKGNLFNAREEKKKKRCHWCGSREFRSLVGCSSCKRNFFCLGCIEERNVGSREEVEMECPICHRSCMCNTCSVTIFRDTECKDLLRKKNEINGVLHLHYLVCMLLPVIKQINVDRATELEREAEMKGQNPSELRTKGSELSCHEQCYCKNCNTDMASVDLHRSCTNGGRDCCQGCLPGESQSLIRKCSTEGKSSLLTSPVVTIQPLNPAQQDCELVPITCKEPPHSDTFDVNAEFSLPHREGSGCRDSLLPLRSLFPLCLTTKLEISAEEIASCYELPETLDKFSSCSFCLGMDKQFSRVNHLKEAARREDASGNFLYYPTVMDFNHNNLEHFQTHWSQGHPVIVQGVVKVASSLSWDPITIFCTYLENSNSKSQNDEADKTTDRPDWFEVDIGIKQLFLGSLRGNAEANTCQEKLKLQGWLSSRLFEEQFFTHYSEVLSSLPIPHYMDPNCGLLNIAAKLPDEIRTPDLGPCLNILYRSGEEFSQPDSVKNLSFDCLDMVDILLNVTETPVTTRQICRIRKLMKKKMSRDRLDGNKEVCGTVDDKANNIERSRSNDCDKDKECRLDRATKQSRFAAKGCDRRQKDSYAGKDCSDYDSSSDSESSLPSFGAKSEDRHFQGEQREGCNYNHEGEDLGNSCGAQWDVFRRQDVPKLVEYLRKHSHKLNCVYSSIKHVSHPLHDGSFYLNEYHKARLKEEFEIEPWTFEQQIGEAVIVPAGCPYQIRKVKSSVNVVFKFVSPEHVAECIQRAEELCLLPQPHKTKGNEVEVKKMAIYKISEAIKEIRKLTSSD